MLGQRLTLTVFYVVSRLEAILRGPTVKASQTVALPVVKGVEKRTQCLGV
jgi:hypothetical protein